MSQAASQAWAFYREVAKNGVIWTIRDGGGFPAPRTASGERAQPLWSSRSRAERIISTVPAYAVFEPYEVSWEDFCNKWVSDLEKEGIKVGVSWIGKRAKGYDLEAPQLRKFVEALIENPQ